MTLCRYSLSCLFAWAIFSCVTFADEADWAEGNAKSADGANRQYYNRAALLPWTHFMGDWRDAKNVEQGEEPFAVAEVKDTDSVQEIKWTVTPLVEAWASGRFPQQGMFLRVIGKKGTILFASREHPKPNLHPRLVLNGSQGMLSLPSAADTHLTKSTYRSQGRAEELRVSNAPDHILLRFDLSRVKEIGKLRGATLVLHAVRQYGDAGIGVFRCRQGHNEPASKPVLGIARRYPHDQGIGKDDAVIFATRFEADNWQEQWTYAGPKGKVDTVPQDSNFKKFERLDGRALRARIAKGSTTALNTLYKFGKEQGAEPQEVYFRYYLRLADDWNQTVQGGKMPGISGTYGKAGWGGRKSNGSNGWSARGLFRQTIPPGNPLGKRTPIGFYCYHADMKSQYGDNWVWTRDYRGYLSTNRWYCIEQFCKLNTVGRKDGVLRAWVDGRLAFEKTDIRFRTTDRLKIEQVWMNVYHGGTTPSPYDQHVFIDNVVIAREYIGPMKR